MCCEYNMNLSLTQLKDTKSSLYFNAIEIYLDSFPPQERQELKIVEERINSQNEMLYVLKLDDDIIGIALIWHFHQIDTFFIDYFAIKNSYQSKGYGSNFINLLKNEFPKESTIVLEVEQPKNSEDLLKLSRIAFYQKSGFSILADFNYFMPSINNQGKCDMKLMYFSEKHNLDKEILLLLKIVDMIFKNVYNNDTDIEQIKILNKIQGI